MKQIMLWAVVCAGVCSAQIDPMFQLTQATNTTFRGTIQFPGAQFTTITQGKEQFTRLDIPGLAPGTGDPGVPAIPRWRALIAIPDGSTPILRLARPVTRPAMKVHVYPYQPLGTEFSTHIDDPAYQRIQPPASLYQGQPFTKNNDAYASPNALPPGPCTPPLVVGKRRDVTIASIECAAGQYTPVSDTLVLFASIDFQIDFQGGGGFFITRASFNPFESDMLDMNSALLNGGIIAQYTGADGQTRYCKGGEELLILSPPDYLAAAKDLAKWRNQQGTPANAFVVNDGAGPGPDTNTAIQQFIDWRYDHCTVRPKAVLLFGDAKAIPTFEITRLLYENTTPPTLIATDFPYASHNSSPTAKLYFPNYSLGRIPVTSADEAQIVVDKIKAYESVPTTDKSFYRSAEMASYFQCCNPAAVAQGTEDGYAFITNSENFRQTLINNSFNVSRMYSTDTAFHKTDYSGDPTPRFFANGTPLPSELLPPNTPWNTKAPDIAGDMNKGANLVFHEDHGWTGGWANPGFSITDVPSLTNSDKMNLVFNMDCSTGNFEVDSFIYHMLAQKGGGAVGMTGFTRMSNVKYFPALTTGLLDAMWPDTDPAFGSNVSRTKLGQMFDWAKLYMVNTWTGGDINAVDAKNTLNHVRLWHLFGDPMMQVWTSVPASLPQIPYITVFPNAIDVPYEIEGVTVSAFQIDSEGGTRPVGRGVVTRGVAHIDFFNAPDPSSMLQVVASAPNAIPVSMAVALAPAK